MAKLRSGNVCPIKNHPSMKNKKVKIASKILHNRYFITLIDKRNGNVVLSYTRCYALALFREFKITNSQSTNIFEHCKNV